MVKVCGHEIRLRNKKWVQVGVLACRVAQAPYRKAELMDHAVWTCAKPGHRFDCLALLSKAKWNLESVDCPAQEHHSFTARDRTAIKPSDVSLLLRGASSKPAGLICMF